MRRTARTDLPGRHPQPGAPQIGRSRLGSRGKALAFGGTALALAGVGAATAAEITAAEITAAAPQAAGVAAATRNLSVTTAAWHDGSPVVVVPGRAHAAAAVAGAPASGTPASAGAPASAAAPAGAGAPASAGAGSGRVETADTVAAAKPAKPAHVVKRGAAGWQQIRDRVAQDTLPHARAGALPLADRLRPGPAQGQQTAMPVSPVQLANVTAIVRAALGQHMGLRSAVIAVATAMQESGLQNISYGDRDSLGLFQQRPSCGWGTAQQITTPSYAAGAFLTALRKHQQADPGWASQPLWANAQAVQNSGFPFAYAKWEAQAAQLVTAAVQHLVG